MRQQQQLSLQLQQRSSNLVGRQQQPHRMVPAVAAMCQRRKRSITCSLYKLMDF
jgi:hypothetical protein